MIDPVKLGADLVVALDMADKLATELGPLISLAPKEVQEPVSAAFNGLMGVLQRIHAEATIGGVERAEAAADALEAEKFPLPGGLMQSEPPPAPEG